MSGAGKTTLSEELYRNLYMTNKISYIDGDEYRSKMFEKLGFSKKDRNINVNSIGILAEYLNRAGINVIVSAIAPYQEARQYNRELINKNGRYFQVYCKCDVDTLKQRDTKGLYSKSNINLTGIDDPYQEPENADIIVNTGLHSIETCITNILIELVRKDFIQPPKKGRII
jgi:adenylyl-sulfate kinase